VTGATRARILIIDDDPQLLAAFRRYISRRHHVEGASGAEEALRLIENGKRFDMLLCDLKMPGMTGMEFYESLLVGWPEQAARVVLMTGGEYSDRAAEFQRDLPERCLYKPIDLAQLGELVEQAVDGRLPRHDRELVPKP
jgi:DNA-binding NtrC family response regulator